MICLLPFIKLSIVFVNKTTEDKIDVIMLMLVLASVL